MISLKILVRESSITKDELWEVLNSSETLPMATDKNYGDRTPPRKDDPLRSQKLQSLVDFMMKREAYRMEQMVAFLTDSDPYLYVAKVMNLVTVYREYQVRALHLSQRYAVI